MKLKYRFLDKYEERGASNPVFNELGIDNYDSRDEIIDSLKEDGYLIETRKGVILEVTEKGQKKLEEIR